MVAPKVGLGGVLTPPKLPFQGLCSSRDPIFCVCSWLPRPPFQGFVRHTPVKKIIWLHLMCINCHYCVNFIFYMAGSQLDVPNGSEEVKMKRVSF